MKLKTIAVNVAIAATVVVGSTTVNSSSTHAATVKPGDVLNFGGSAKLLNAGNPIATLEFESNEAVVIKPSSSVFGTAAPPFSSATTFTIGNLSLANTGGGTWKLTTPFSNWLTGLDNGIEYTLETFNLRQIGSKFEADYTGFFTPPTQGVPGLGSLTSQGSFSLTDGSSFSSTITAVPTPALLPGLLGMGAAALRKKRREEGLEATPEAVEVDA